MAKSSSNSNFSFVVNKFGEAGRHTIGTTGSATKIAFEGFELSEYGLIATDVDIRENEDTSIHTTCGDYVYMYSTGPGAVSITVEGSVVYPKLVPTSGMGSNSRDSREVRKRKIQEKKASEGNQRKDPVLFWQKYKASTYGAIKLRINDGTYYVLLIGWDLHRTSDREECGSFSLSFVGKAT